MGFLKVRSADNSAWLTKGKYTPPVVAPVTSGRTTAASAVRRTQDVCDIFGVAGHLTYGGTPYENRAQVTAAMDYMLCKNFRDGWGTGRQAIGDYVLADFRPRGIKLCLTGDARDYPAGTTWPQVVALHKGYGYIADVKFWEGANEYDLDNNITKARDDAKALHAALKADPDCAHILRASPSLADTNTDSKYQQLAGMPDVQVVTFHDYYGVDFQHSGPSTPTDAGYAINNTKGRNGRYVLPTPSGTLLPTISTETGSSDATSGDAGKNMPRSAFAGQALRVWLENARGIPSGDRALDVLLSCHYELVDQGTANTTEQKFGLFDNAWNPKDAATAIRNQMMLLVDGASTSRSFTPTPLNHTWSGTNDDFRQVPMQKSDGSWWIAVWQEVLTWNGSTILSPAPLNVTLNLPSPRTVTSYDPVSGQTGTAVGTASSFALQSKAHPTLFKVV